MRRASSFGIVAILLACGGLITGHLSAQEDLPIAWPSEIIPEWAVVGRSDGLRTVFISPDGLRDRHFVAQVLRRIVEGMPGTGRLEVHIYDARRHTPPRTARTPQELQHLRARYLLDPSARIERFVWVSLEDARANPPRFKEMVAPISVLTD